MAQGHCAMRVVCVSFLHSSFPLRMPTPRAHRLRQTHAQAREGGGCERDACGDRHGHAARVGARGAGRKVEPQGRQCRPAPPAASRSGGGTRRRGAAAADDAGAPRGLVPADARDALAERVAGADARAAAATASDERVGKHADVCARSVAAPVVLADAAGCGRGPGVAAVAPVRACLAVCVVLWGDSAPFACRIAFAACCFPVVRCRLPSASCRSPARIASLGFFLGPLNISIFSCLCTTLLPPPSTIHRIVFPAFFPSSILCMRIYSFAALPAGPTLDLFFYRQPKTTPVDRHN